MQNSPSTTLAPVPKNRREGLRSAEKTALFEQANLEPSESSQISESSFPIDPQIVTTVPSPPSSPTTLPSSEDDNMTTRVNESGRIELSSGKSGPRVKAGAILSPEDLDDLYEDARRYAKSRTKDDIENVRDIIAEAFPARVHRDWFRSEKNVHLALVLESVDDSDPSAPSTFPFLDVLRRKFCGHDWAQVHAARRDELKMNVGGVGCFDEYLSQVEGCNSRLKGVGNYLTPPQLLTILARGIAPTLTAILSEQGIVIDEETTYKSWVSACRDLEVRFKTRLNSADRQGRRGAYPYGTGNTSTNNNPAHKRNTTSEPSSYPNKRPPSAAGSTANNGVFYMKSFKSMPEALQKEQRDLLGWINACPKCRTAWATCGSNLDNCPGATLSVPWRPLTTEMVDWAISAHKSTNRPILYNTILKQAVSKTTVAVVHGAPLDDISAYVDNVDRRAPVAAAIYGTLPVSHIARDAQVYGSFAGPALLSSRSSSRANVVAPVVGQHRLAHDDDDDEVDWSDGSASPSPKPVGVEVVGPREPSVEL
ncbi:hypothetical protein C8J55DRAFT_492803 [Lentinula edodes]|uniref:Uncharacterized protein n=1 Tax=Lentinula lateritia TaxID=40482 RepID=A0A9W8ZVZ5_9AGAR|nr:hypothetical protein C8J55DRAFT_492803 [Lentinula edodes]